MKATIDDKGRIQLPAEVRRDVQLEPGDTVDVCADSSGMAIIILPLPPRCAVCGKQGVPLATFGDDPVREICEPCHTALTSTPLVFPAKH